MVAGSGDSHRELIQSLDVIFWEADPATLRFTSVSLNAEAVLGYPNAEWISNPNLWGDMIHPDDRERVLVARVMAVRRCEEHRLAYRVVTQDRRTRSIREAVRVTCVHGQPKAMWGVMIDVTT